MQRMNLSTVSLLVAFALLLGFKSQSFAAETDAASRFNVGGLVGYGLGNSSIEGSQGISGVDFGAEFAYQFRPNWEVGLEWTMVPYSQINNGANTSGYSISTYLASFSYHFSDVFNPLYIGVEAGIGTMGYPSSIGYSAVVNPIFGTKIGYDFQLFGGLSIGPLIEFDVMPVTSSTQTIQGIAYNLPAQTMTLFQALGAVKYWF